MLQTTFFGRILLLCCAATAVLSGCSKATNSSDARAAFAGGGENIPAFNADAAYASLKKQVDFGPRYPGAPGHKETAEYITAELRKYADGVSPQRFTESANGKTLQMENINAYFNPEAKKWVLLMAHWDTRPTADMEVTLDKKNKPIPGANDGASGTAVLLELAKMFAKQRPGVGVMMVFLDGEDYGPGVDNMFYGSRYFAEHLQECARVRGKPVKFSYGILLDMVGDKDLKFYEENNSLKAAPDVVKKVWDVADKLGYKKSFIPESKYSIEDDHLPLIDAGVKCIDIIDFDYGPWHTLDDTPDKCSPQSLEKVGNVVAHVIYEESGL